MGSDDVGRGAVRFSSSPLVASVALVALVALVPLPSGIACAQRPIDAERALVAETALYRHAELYGIEVQSMVGFLYLRGAAPDEDAVEKALELARTVPGIQEVRNRMQLRDVDSRRLPDSRIAADVMRVIGMLPGLDATVRDGHVAVSGDARDPLAAQQLVARLRQVEGIRTLDLEGLRYASAEP